MKKRATMRTNRLFVDNLRWGTRRRPRGAAELKLVERPAVIISAWTEFQPHYIRAARPLTCVVRTRPRGSTKREADVVEFFIAISVARTEEEPRGRRATTSRRRWPDADAQYDTGASSPFNRRRRPAAAAGHRTWLATASEANAK